MNREQLEEIRKRAEAASKGPWRSPEFDVDEGTWFILNGQLGMEEHAVACIEPAWSRRFADANAEFISRARADVPALLDEIDRLTRELDTMREVAQGNKRHVAYLMSEMEQVTCATCGVGLKVAAGTWFHAGPGGDYRAPHAPAPVFADASTAEGSAEGGTSKGSEVSP